MAKDAIDRFDTEPLDNLAPHNHDFKIPEYAKYAALPPNAKLSIDEFAKKYWLGGTAPYQYHTMSVEDGETLLDQRMIANIRAIWQTRPAYVAFKLGPVERIAKQAEEKARQAKIAAAAGLIVGAAGVALALLAYFR